MDHNKKIENAESSSRGNLPYPVILTLDRSHFRSHLLTGWPQLSPEEFALHLLSELPYCRTVVIVFVIIVATIHWVLAVCRPPY